MDINGVNEYLSNNDNVSLVGLIVAIASLVIAAIGLIISIIVLVLTFKTWKLKCGISVLGWYGITSSIESNTPYVSEIKLQNTKDKELAISNIYIHFGENVYIDMLEKDSRFDKYDIVIPYMYTGIQYKYSLFTKRNNLDCSEIAKKLGEIDGLGGGGHAQAAGFQTYHNIFEKDVVEIK